MPIYAHTYIPTTNYQLPFTNTIILVPGYMIAEKHLSNGAMEQLSIYAFVH